jgi:hypothetical protein
MSNICVAGTCAATAPVDAGSPDSGAGDRGDAGRPRPDSGRDAGKDSGHVGERGDAAVRFPEEPTKDASMDGSLEAVDASTPGISATGSGCACRTSPSGSNHEGILWLSVSLGVLACRRKRARHIGVRDSRTLM